MKSLLIFTVTLFLTAGGRSQTRQVSTNEVRAQVDSALSFVPGGRELYRVSDLFQRLVDRRVAIHLGLFNTGITGMKATSPESDTSEELDISKTGSNEDEPSIAISRKNSSLIVAGANDDAMYSTGMPAYVSTNAGATWRTYRLPYRTGLSDSGDPIIIADDSGYFYYAFMVTDDRISYGQPYRSDLLVARSQDGIHWTQGGLVLHDTASASIQDKEMIAVDHDPNSPYHGRLYIVWTKYFDGWTDQRLISHSDDYGKTWSNPVEWTTEFGYIPTIRVGAGGAVFIASSHIDSLRSNARHAVSVSTDGGNTFTDHPIADYTDYPETGGWLNALKGDSVLPDSYGFRAFPYITLNVDPRSNAAYAVYGTWNANGFASQYAVRSANMGISWSAPQIIGSSDALNYDHFFPWVSIDTLTHDVSIALYTSEGDPNNLDIQAARTSFDNPSNIQAIGPGLFDPTLLTASGVAPFLGDYIGADEFDGTYAVAWTENQKPNHSDGDIFAYISSPILPGGQNSVRSINEDHFDVSVSPNPASGNFAFLRISTNQERTAIIRAFNLNGHVVSIYKTELSPGDANPVQLDIKNLPAGVYHIAISSGADVLNRNLVVLR